MGFYAALDSDETGISISSDRTGSVPVFYIIVKDRLFFAPEIKALLAVCGRPELDTGAVAKFLASGMLYRDRTLFRGITRIPSGERIIVAAGTVTTEVWWRYLPGTKAEPRASEAALRDQLINVLRQSGKVHCGDADLCVFLSGGVDSRVNAILAREFANPEGLTSVSWGDFLGSDKSDIAVAKRVADRLNIPHSVVLRQPDLFGTAFERVNRILDGQSQIAGEVPGEVLVMDEIRATGVQRVLRGDEAFGWQGPVDTLEEAWAIIGVRRPREIARLGALLAPGVRAAALDESETIFDALTRRYGDLPPNVAKDAMYLEVRLLNYLNNSAYVRKTIFDERNLLIDDVILDFMPSVSDRLRAHKNLFMQAVKVLDRPKPLPLATQDNKEEWRRLMQPTNPVGAYVAGRIRGSASAIWDILDRTATLALFDRLGAMDPEPSPRQRLGAFVHEAGRRLRDIAPTALKRIYGKRQRSGLSDLVLARRVLVLADLCEQLEAA